MCLAGSVVASWSLTQEVAGWQRFEPFYYNDKYFVTEFSKFRENVEEKLRGDAWKSTPPPPISKHHNVFQCKAAAAAATRCG